MAVKLEDVVRSLPGTEILYWPDSYLKVFKARVLRVESEKGRNAYVVLDRTAFHPKSGGQPSDKGHIRGNGFTVRVEKAMFAGEVVVHYGKVIEGEVKPDAEAAGEIDWAQRYLYMRRHTAGHLFDYCLTVVTGKRVETTDSWLGDRSYVGYGGNTPPEDAVRRAEDLENMTILKGARVVVETVSREELLRRAPEAPNIYRLPELASYRIVTIEDCDPIPCGGCHLRNVKEVGKFVIDEIASADHGFRVYYDVS